MKKYLVLTSLLVILFSCTKNNGPVYKSFDSTYFPFYQFELGKYVVGFKSILLRDSVRAFGDQSMRPVLTGIWYPAEYKIEDEQLDYGDYVLANSYRTGEPVGNTTKPDLKLEFSEALNRFFGIEASQADKLFELPVKAFKSATMVEGKFPLILYAASFNAGIQENSALWEMLASHGYVVATIASVGSEAAPMSADTLGINAQNDDFKLVYDWMLDQSNVDTDNIATFGFSWGAFPAILTGLEKGVNAIITYDGSNNYFPPLNEIYDSSYRSNYNGAYAQFNQRRGPTARLPFDSAVFNIMKERVNSYLFMFKTMDHRDFGASFQFSNDITNDSIFEATQIRTYGSANSRVDKAQGYHKSAAMVKDLLDAYLKQNSEALIQINSFEDEQLQLNRIVLNEAIK